MAGPGSPRDPWLPDLCRLPRLLVMLGMAELVVVLLVLAPLGIQWTPRRFVATSAFALWLALTVSVLLCVGRERLLRLQPRWTAAIALAGATSVAALTAAATHAIGTAAGLMQWQDDALVFVGGIALITLICVGAVLRYLYVIDGWRSQVQAAARAQIDAMQARINPHFLFNSMNSIAVLVRRDPEVAERAVLDLSDLFRAALGAGTPDSNLREEVELAQRYLAIERLRFGERLAARWELDESLPWDLPMPRLLLQPLVENAVQHGVALLAEGGEVSVALRADAGLLWVVVGNPAPPPGTHAAERPHARHAQASIAHRLAHAFGPQARMTAGWNAGYYRVELRVPTGGGGAQGRDGEERR